MAVAVVSVARRAGKLATATKLATVAVSECLRGSAVRWDGDHNGDVWPRAKAERLFHLTGLCPEVGIGLGVPREPIQLLGDGSGDGPWRAVAVADPARDCTARLAAYAGQAAPILDGVAGYIFADRSPSCGLAGVKVFDAGGGCRRIGRGIYAAAVLAARPELPAVDAETLNDDGALLAFALAVAAFAGEPDAAAAEARIRELLGIL